MPPREVRVPSETLQVLIEELGGDVFRYEDGLPERMSPPFTREVALDVLQERLDISRGEAARLFRRLLRHHNILGVSEKPGCPKIIDIGEWAGENFFEYFGRDSE